MRDTLCLAFESFEAAEQFARGIDRVGGLTAQRYGVRVEIYGAENALLRHDLVDAAKAVSGVEIPCTPH